MSTYAPQGMKKKPSLAGIVIAVVMMILGPVVGIILIIASAVGSTADLTEAQSYSSKSEAQVTLTAGEAMALWATNHSWDCTIEDSAGNNIPLLTPVGTSQSVGRYSLVATFTPVVTGPHTVNCTGSETVFEFKIAPSMSVGGLVGGLLVGIFLIIGGLFLGLILLIVTIVRRSNWKRQYGPRLA